MKRLIAALSAVAAVLALSACAQDLEGISATGFYPPELEAKRNAVDPLFGMPDGIEAFQ